MNKKFESLIKSCNNSILACEGVLKTCQKCVSSCKSNKCDNDLAENCGQSCQKIIDTLYKCIHECNQIIEKKLFESDKQEKMLKKCLDVCHETIRRCQTTTNQVLDKNFSIGCTWSLDALNNCISACDECIESFEG